MKNRSRRFILVSKPVFFLQVFTNYRYDLSDLSAHVILVERRLPTTLESITDTRPGLPKRGLDFRYVGNRLTSFVGQMGEEIKNSANENAVISGAMNPTMAARSKQNVIRDRSSNNLEHILE